MLSLETLNLQSSGLIPGYQAIAPHAAELFKAPLGAASAATIAKKVTALRNVQNRFATIDRHVTLALLRIFLEHIRAVYMLHSKPAFELLKLVYFNSTLREFAVVSNNIRLDKTSLKQACLPPNKGELGLITPCKIHYHLALLSAPPFLILVKRSAETLSILTPATARSLASANL